MIRTKTLVFPTLKQVADSAKLKRARSPAMIRPRGAVLLSSIVGRTLPKKEGS